jgi:hypothetical protein
VALHPATILGFVLAVWTMWGLNWGEAPVLNRAGANTSLPLVLIGAGGLIAVTEASIRMWRTEQSEAIDIAPASPHTRTVALLVAAATPVVLALILQFAVLGVMMLDRPATALDWWDALIGPATVALLAAAGVAAGRWVPSRATGPLTLILLGGASLYVGTYDVRQSYGDWMKWLAPIVPLEFEPVELEFRPTGRHLIYVTALIAVFVCLALLRGRTRRHWVPLAVLLVSFGVGVGGVVSQSTAYKDYDPTGRLQALLMPEAEHVCEQQGSVTYCAYPDYQPWIEEWAALVQPVLDLAPDAVSRRPLELHQYPTRALDLLLSGDPPVAKVSDLATGLWWGRQAGGKGNGRWGDSYPFGMALGAASWAVGLPLDLVAGSWEVTRDSAGEILESRFVAGSEGIAPEEVSYQACTTADQARGLVALWMAAQASPVTEQHLRNQIDHPDYPLVEESVNPDGTIVYGYQGLAGSIDVSQPYPWYALDFQMREAYYAYQLLERPQAEVAGLIHANWEQLTDPETTTLEALAVLGVEPLPGFEGQVVENDFYWQYPPCE